MYVAAGCSYDLNANPTKNIDLKFYTSFGEYSPICLIYQSKKASFGVSPQPITGQLCKSCLSIMQKYLSNSISQLILGFIIRLTPIIKYTNLFLRLLRSFRLIKAITPHLPTTKTIPLNSLLDRLYGTLTTRHGYHGIIHT